MKIRTIKRLRWSRSNGFKNHLYAGPAYYSTNIGITYWIRPTPDPRRPWRLPCRGCWNVWTLYKGHRRLGTYNSMMDAQLAGQKDWENMHPYPVEAV